MKASSHGSLELLMKLITPSRDNKPRRISQASKTKSKEGQKEASSQQITKALLHVNILSRPQVSIT